MNNRRIAVHSGHSTGKSFCAADIAIWYKIAFPGSKVITTAPSNRQVEKVLWGTMRKRINGAREPLGGKLLPVESEWKFGDDEFALGFASKDYDPHAMSGFHAEHLLIIIDEAAGVAPLVWDACTRIATGRLNTILAIGNPGDASGPFYEACMENDRWATVHLDAEQHPNVLTGEELIPGGATREFIEDKAEEYGGKDDWRYQAFVRGYFPEGGERTLIRRIWVEDAFAREPKHKGYITIGVDPAGYGPDEAVVVVFRGKDHLATYTQAESDPLDFADMVATVAKKHGCVHQQIIVDADGEGSGVYSALKREGFNAWAFRGGMKPPEFQPGKKFDRRWETYQNLRTMAWFELARALRRGECSLKPDRVAKKQLVALEYKYQASGLQQLQSKDDKDLREKLDGGSPDRGDALAMAWWGIVTRGAARYVPGEKKRKRAKRFQDEYDEMVGA